MMHEQLLVLIMNRTVRARMRVGSNLRVRDGDTWWASSRERIRRGPSLYELENARSTCAERATRDCSCINGGRTREQEGKGQLHSFGQRILDGTHREDVMPLYENLFKGQMHYSRKCILNVCLLLSFCRFLTFLRVMLLIVCHNESDSFKCNYLVCKENCKENYDRRESKSRYKIKRVKQIIVICKKYF